jgi:hypothetical protein
MSLASALRFHGQWKMSWRQTDLLGDDAEDCFNMKKSVKTKELK